MSDVKSKVFDLANEDHGDMVKYKSFIFSENHGETVFYVISIFDRKNVIGLCFVERWYPKSHCVSPDVLLRKAFRDEFKLVDFHNHCSELFMKVVNKELSIDEVLRYGKENEEERVVGKESIRVGAGSGGLGDSRGGSVESVGQARLGKKGFKTGRASRRGCSVKK